MSLRDELLAPIAGDNPGGVELRYEPVFDKIKEARREDDDIPQGEWATTLKTADWPLVIKLSKEALSTRSKDLQVAAWLTEALVRREGFPGLQAGLDVLTGLIDRFWGHLYPEIDDGDAEMRAAPLEWVGLKLDIPVRRVAIDRLGHDFLGYKASRTVPTEALAAESEEKQAARADAIASGRPTPESIDAGFTATPKSFYKALVADIESCMAALAALEELSADKFGSDAPSFIKLKDALTDSAHVASQLLKRKLEVDPDPVDAPTIGGDTTAVEAAPGAAVSAPAAMAGVARGPLAAEPTSRDDATSRITGAAKYLRKTDPFNPASYLMLRGLRWGELRAGSGSLDPRLLEAPSTQVRTTLKGLLLDSRWTDLLELSETVLGTPQGRGWVDLQRYAISACDALGSDYFPVANAMRGALRSLLADLPQLLEMTLMDDTPTANVETRAWLRSSVVLESSGTDAPSDGALPEETAEPRGRDPLSLALAEVRAGRTDRAIALLMREAGREKTSRGRFLLQAQLARIMVDAGHDSVATPVLDQLMTDIDAHKLEEWEDGELVASSLALLYRVLERTEGDLGTRQGLYQRICRLDPIQAISLTQP